jgi:hypothetical protein
MLGEKLLKVRGALHDRVGLSLLALSPTIEDEKYERLGSHRAWSKGCEETSGGERR